MLHGRIERIHIEMEDDPVHRSAELRFGALFYFFNGCFNFRYSSRNRALLHDHPSATTHSFAFTAVSDADGAELGKFQSAFAAKAATMP